MKVHLLLSITFLIPTMALSASTGAISGGGGKAVVCRDATGAITSAETLDLYEGRVMYGLEIPKMNQPLREQLAAALLRLPLNASRAVIDYQAGNVQKNMRLIPKDAQLAPIDDSYEAVIPKDCKVEQLANFYSENLILVSLEIWEHLSETDKAALIFHEAFYQWERALGATDSQRSRRVGAQLFSPNTKWTEPNDMVPKDAMTCATFLDQGVATNGSYFWVVRGGGKTGLQFQMLGGQWTVSKKYLDYFSPNLDFSDNFKIIQGEDRIGEGVTTYLRVKSDFENNDSVVLAKKWETIRDSRTGEIVRGWQTVRYYLGWQSNNYPGKNAPLLPLNCSIQTKGAPK